LNSLITNNHTSNFYNHLIEQLSNCDSFIFNVAFINYSGVQLLIDSLEKCKNKNIKGKILTSTYLGFTQPKALEKLKQFENIELKIFDCDEQKLGFHVKSYIFEYKDEYKILLGSSNITASAFKTNIEWNIQTINKKDDSFVKTVLNEFYILWEKSINVNKEFLESYYLFYNEIKNSSKKFIFDNKITTNYMQEKALKNLENLRSKGENKALVIASTGSGKTYLSAFDVKQYNANRVLFLVHRENILLSAKKSFESVIKNKTMGLYTGNKKELETDYLFSTIQTMSLNYQEFNKNEFDYIIIDEAHHVSSPSYKRVINHFRSKFLLGLTATSNRTDGQNIYEVFDDNIACDIRLNDALEHNLVVPFHYFGINDISVDMQNLDLTKIDEIARILQVNRRVDFVIEKMNFYSYTGSKRKALGFCVSKEHAKYMSEEFNKRGIDSIYLTSNDSVDKREKVIKQLEDDKHSLEIIFSVDIFNEGVDIPSINTVLMLRPTNSPIVFAQQLGRGLRRYKNKEFLTVLDFIGNHKKAYLVVLSLLGDKKIDKESMKISILNNFANIDNAFISMDEISKKRVLEQINSENFNAIKYLKEQYLEFKLFLGNKIPSMVDFFKYDEFIDPIDFINHSKSYIEFLQKVEKSDKLNKIVFDELFIKAIRFIDYMLPIKRVYEFVVLKELLDKNSIDIKIASNLLKKYLDEINENTINHSFKYLSHEFFDSAQKKRYLKLVEFENDKLIRSKEFELLLENSKYKKILKDSINYGLLHYEQKFSTKNYGMPFLKLYEKYNMLNIAQLCNFPKIHSSFRGSGFLKYENDFFLFINLEKEKFSKSSHYENAFISKDTFTYQSKPSMSSDKGDGQRLVENKKYGVKLHIFVRKFAQVDKQTQAFIYLGLANTIKYWDEKPIFTHLKLEKILSDDLYEEFTKVI
jgi:superfamily II DNA or RNA helicase